MRDGRCNLSQRRLLPGEIAEEGISKVGNATISGAIILPSEILSQYSGAKVLGIRVGLVTVDGISDLSGWVRTSLDGDDLDSGSGADLSAGWNYIPLSGNMTLSGEHLASRVLVQPAEIGEMYLACRRRLV